MATKTRSKAKPKPKTTAAVAGSNGAANGHANGKPAVEPILDYCRAVEVLESELDDACGYTYVNGIPALRRQEARVDELRSQLAIEEAKLRRMLAPINRVREYLAQIRDEPPTEPWDDELKQLLAKMRTTRSSYRGRQEPNGAIAWKELRTRGATDAQVWKNLEVVDAQASYRGEYRLALHHKPPAFTHLAPNQVRSVPLVSGKPELIAAVRRVMGIGPPANAAAAKKTSKAVVGFSKAAAKKSSSKKAAKTPAKRPARTKAAPAAKTGPQPADPQQNSEEAPVLSD